MHDIFQNDKVVSSDTLERTREELLSIYFCALTGGKHEKVLFTSGVQMSKLDLFFVDWYFAVVI